MIPTGERRGSSGVLRQLASWVRGPNARLLGCCVAGSVVLAVMTGPEGSNVQPTSGIVGSLHLAHLGGYLVFGVVLFAAIVLGRRARRGELAGLSAGVRSARARLAEWRLRALQGGVKGGVAFAVLLVALAVVAVVAADFTGPYHTDKLSWHQLAHQFSYEFTYGYLGIALLAWWAMLREARARRAAATRAPRTPAALRAVLVVVACVAGALVFALAANPWLSPRLHWSDVALVGRGTSIFGQWPTYLYVAAALLVARGLLKATPSAAAGTLSLSRRTARPLSMTWQLLALFVAIEMPRFLPSYWQSDLVLQIGTFALLALGLNVVVGFAGLLDLGYIAFYAVGAYVTAYFTGELPVHPPHVFDTFAVIPIAIIAAMLAGVLLGLPTLRIGGDYFAIVTLGFGEIIVVLLNNWTTVTNGSIGTGYVPQFSINLLGIHYQWNNNDLLPYYYLLLAFVILAILVFSRINDSRVGRRWSAIREDGAAAASLGVNPLKYKVMAFAIGASTAGFAGVFTASVQQTLYPSNFVLQGSILILALVIFGGMGSIFGVLFGAAFFQWIYLELQLHPIFGYNQADFFMYVGAILVLMMIFRPRGVFPSRQRARELQLAEAGVGMADPMQAEREHPESPLVHQ